MPITSSDIKFKLSGGATNTDGNASLGGAISINDAPTTLNGLFDRVSAAESASGDTEYRCIYVKNNHPSLTLYAARIWISANTPSPDTTIEIGLGTSAIGGVEQTVANEDTAPTGVTFSAPSNYDTALSIGDIPAGQHKAIWIKRIVNPNAAAYSGDSFTITVRGETAA